MPFWPNHGQHDDQPLRAVRDGGGADRGHYRAKLFLPVKGSRRDPWPAAIMSASGSVARGVVFDMAKGTATQLLADEIGPSCDLTKLYSESKRSIYPLVDWVTGSIVA